MRYLSIFLINKLRRLKIYLLKGEKSLSAEMELHVFTYTELLLFGIKYTMRNIYLMHVMAVQIHIKIFELPLFSWDSLEDLIRNSKITGARAETVDIFPVVHLYIFIVAEETVQLTNDFSTNKQLKC